MIARLDHNRAWPSHNIMLLTLTRYRPHHDERGALRKDIGHASNASLGVPGLSGGFWMRHRGIGGMGHTYPLPFEYGESGRHLAAPAGKAACTSPPEVRYDGIWALGVTYHLGGFGQSGGIPSKRDKQSLYSQCIATGVCQTEENPQIAPDNSPQPCHPPLPPPSLSTLHALGRRVHCIKPINR